MSSLPSCDLFQVLSGVSNIEKNQEVKATQINEAKVKVKQVHKEMEEAQQQMQKLEWEVKQLTLRKAELSADIQLANQEKDSYGEVIQQVEQLLKQIKGQEKQLEEEMAKEEQKKSQRVNIYLETITQSMEYPMSNGEVSELNVALKQKENLVKDLKQFAQTLEATKKKWVKRKRDLSQVKLKLAAVKKSRKNTHLSNRNSLGSLEGAKITRVPVQKDFPFGFQKLSVESNK